MRLKSQQSTNQRIKTCVANIILLCLLTTEVVMVVAAATPRPKRPGFARQLGDDKTKVNNVDDSLVSNSYHQPHFTENRSVIVQLFEWKFFDIAEECRLFLGPQGYAGVQLSPVLEHTVVKTSELNHPWWERYEIISYRLASRSGDESEFWSMSRICNDNGVRIYADVVLNHMAAPLHLLAETNGVTTNKDFIVDTLLESQVNISTMQYSNVSYTQQDFHRPCAMAKNTHDAHEIRNCQLNGHPDLDHSRTAVQQHIVEMLNKFIDMGVAGFRIDTAKYIWPIDLKNIYGQVKDLNQEFGFKENTRPFFYHDVFDMGMDTVSKTEYATYGVVSEYLYPAILSTVLNGKAPLSSLINWGPAMGFLAHQDSLVFVDSHDTQRGLPQELGQNHMLTYKQRIKYIMANAFMLAHPYGNIKRIMSSYYYADNDINQGPPVEEKGDDDGGDDDGDSDNDAIRSPKFNAQQQCTYESGWVCEHRWPPVVNMVKLANYFQVSGQQVESVVNFQTNGPNQIAFCRGLKAFVAINNDPDMDFIKEVYACLEPGIYCDIIGGGKKEDGQSCHGRQLEVNDQGYAKLVVPVADKDLDDNGEQENEIGEEEGEEEAGKVESYGILVIYVESKIEVKEEEDQNEVDNNIEANPEGDVNNEELEVSVNDDKEDDNGMGDTEDGNPSDDEDKESETDQLEEDNEAPLEDPSEDTPGDPNDDPNDDPNQEDNGDNEVDTDIEKSEDQPLEDNPETFAEGNGENTEDNTVNINEEEIIDEEDGGMAKLPNNSEHVIEHPQEDNADVVENADQPESENEVEPETENGEEETEAKNEPDEGNVEEEQNEEETPAAEQTENDDDGTSDAKEIVEEVDNENEEQANQEENPEEPEKDEESPKEEDPEQGETPEEVKEEAAENVVETPDIETANPEETETENTADDVSEQTFTEVEKPSAEIDDLNKASDSPSTKAQDIQKAGIFSLSNKDGNNG